MPKQLTWSFNWRKSPQHMLFLKTFLKMRPANEHPQLPADSDWQSLLQEPPEKAIVRFRVHGVLVKASLYERLDHFFKVEQLKEMLRERDLPVSGTKKELITRLITTDQAGMWSALPDVELLQCSSRGYQAIEEWMGDPSTISELRKLGDKRIIAAFVAILVWLLKDAILPELLGSSVYDLLTGIDESTARELKRYKPQIGSVKFTYVTPALKLEWCFVPAGYFLMGSKENDPAAYDNEKPQHRVYMPAFYLGRYPITNQQYQVFVRASGFRSPSYWKNGRIPVGKSNHPVASANWNDAMAFCQWAAKASGLPIRLLTEAEWEKGARGTKGLIYPWGNKWHSGYSNSGGKIGSTTSVDHFPKGVSPYGVHDMIGNVWEWTSTSHKPYPYRADDGRESIGTGSSHILRGGSYNTSEKWSRAAYRSLLHYYDLWRDLGFRVGWSAPFSPGA